MIKGFIFDFDGVLFDTNKYHFQSWKESLNHFNVNFNENIYSQIKGLSRKDSVNFLTLNYDQFTEKKKQELFKRKNDIFLDLIKELKWDDLMEGVKEFIFRFKKTHKLGVASSSRNAKHILEKMNFDQFFDVIIDANIVEESKPNPKVFLKCAKFLNLKPEECVVFEDSKYGVMAAKRGGFLTYLVGNSDLSRFADKCIIDLTYYK